VKRKSARKTSDNHAETSQTATPARPEVEESNVLPEGFVSASGLHFPGSKSHGQVASKKSLESIILAGIGGHNILGSGPAFGPILAQQTRIIHEILFVYREHFGYHLPRVFQAFIYAKKLKRKFRSKNHLTGDRLESLQHKNTTRHKSTNWKVSRRFESGLECSLATLMNGVCTIWFSRYWIIRSMNISRAFCTKIEVTVPRRWIALGA